MKRTLKYEIDKMKVSNTKWVLNHIQEHLKDEKYVTEMNEDWLWFRDRFGWVDFRAGYIQGNISVYTNHNLLFVQIGYANYAMLIFIISLIAFWMSFFLKLFIPDYWLGIFMGICGFVVFVSFLNGINRYFRIRTVAKNINWFIHQVC